MSSGDTAIPAVVQWAQRKDKVYLTICLEDVQEKQLDLTPTCLTFSGVGGTDRKPHAVTLEFFSEVNPDESRHLVTGREIVMSIKKKESGPYWPRLTADKVKRHWLKTDFNRWLDEDEAEAAGRYGGGGGGGFGGDENLEAMMAQMGGGFGGGGGGYGEDNDADNDDGADYELDEDDIDAPADGGEADDDEAAIPSTGEAPAAPAQAAAE